LLSAFNSPSIASVSLELNILVPQNVHGPSPSLTQITLPHDWQFGAADCKGCRVATQLHRRAAGSPVARGLVESSRVRMAESRSVRAVEAPFMGVPPAMEIFVAGLGVEVRDEALDF